MQFRKKVNDIETDLSYEMNNESVFFSKDVFCFFYKETKTHTQYSTNFDFRVKKLNFFNAA